MSKAKDSINEKMVKLDKLLAWFDGDDFEIEVAAAKFVEAKELAIAIERDLEEVKNSITILSEQFDREK